jgi:hypothetical protein
MSKDDIENKDYKYILIDRSDPELMWNCAVSIIVFIILLFFLYMNWKPLCSTASSFDKMSGLIDANSIYNSLGETSGISETSGERVI